MKSHANKIKLNELFSLLNVDLGGYSNSLEIEWTYHYIGCNLTKLGGKTNSTIMIRNADMFEVYYKKRKLKSA